MPPSVMERSGRSEAAVRAPDDPLTERILARLPGRGSTWIALWALLVFVRPVFYEQVLRLTGTPWVPWEFVRSRHVPHIALTYMVVLSFWAVRTLAREIRALEPVLGRLVEGPGAAGIFAGMSSAAGPLVLTALVTVVTVVDLTQRYGLTAPLVFLPYLILPVIPLMTLFWVYLMLLAGLNAAGRREMKLGPFPEDCSLGLAPIGVLAFRGFLIFCAATLPFMLTNLRSRFDLLLGLTFFVAGVAAFFLSMWRLHRQMLAAKGRHLAWARGLYAEAYAPVRANVTLEAIRERAPLVSAAEALEKRAAAIQEWPFDDRTTGRIVGISMGVVTAVITRMVLRSLGL